jgi:hypothetical protein
MLYSPIIFGIFRDTKTEAIMNNNTANVQKRLYIIAVIVLLIGLGSAASVYLTAGNAADNQEIHFENSKRYVHNLEVYGGKMNVLADQLCRWFDGLWHGRSLALTISCITLFVSLVIFLVALNSPPDPNPAPQDEDRPRD